MLYSLPPGARDRGWILISVRQPAVRLDQTYYTFSFVISRFEWHQIDFVHFLVGWWGDWRKKEGMISAWDNPVKTVGLNYQFSLTSLVLWHFMKEDASHFSSAQLLQHSYSQYQVLNLRRLSNLLHLSSLCLFGTGAICQLGPAAQIQIHVRLYILFINWHLRFLRFIACSHLYVMWCQ